MERENNKRCEEIDGRRLVERECGKETVGGQNVRGGEAAYVNHTFTSLD